MSEAKVLLEQEETEETGIERRIFTATEDRIMTETRPYV